ncbi:hypothetical protein ACFLSE_04070 [Bacteroidota bacterium]
MKKLKYIIIFILGLGMFNSCLIDNDSDLDQNETGYNLVGFASVSTTVAGISDGNEYDFEVDLKLVGPTSMDITSDITVTIGAHSSSTGIAGTHFRIDNPTVVLEAANNHLGKFEFTMLTAGIVAPLDTAPHLVLEVVEATGDPKVENNGKTLDVTLSYQCFSNLAGSYDCTMQRDGGTIYNYVDNITATGVGAYRTSEVGHWIGGLGVGTPGYTFYDECNKISIPGQMLVNYYSNWVEGTKAGAVDPVTGIITTEYSITSSWASTYANTYVPQ